MTRLPIVVPDLGMQSEEIMFGAWLKQAGDDVIVDEDLFEIEADKATVVCEAPAGGTLAEIVTTSGVVRTGDVVGWLDA
jgi:pyruvate/2-oxoglutarate dehydrogenase complex dihydrolipoamide acyltransferase (E2) component